MIKGIEISKSDRSKCSYCGRLIGKGTPRGWERVQGGTYTSEKYFCYKCTLILIDEGIKSQQQLKKDLKNEIKRRQKEIILMEL